MKNLRRPYLQLLMLAFLAFATARAEESPSIPPEATEASPAALPPSSTNSVTGTENKAIPEQSRPEKSASTPGPSEQDSDPEKPAADGHNRRLPPLTPDLANLNLAEDLELLTLDTKEKVFLPAGTYRQVLRIPIDSPLMQSTQKTRLERRPEVRLPEQPLTNSLHEKKPFWIRYESLEKIKINDEERRGGLDLPIHGPATLKLRLWYAKSETADTASSVFYFLFGGLGYGVANLAGWSAGNTREIPGDFEYRLVRR